MTDNVGYSGRALIDKLGIKSGARVKTRNAPDNYLELLQPIPDDVCISSRLRQQIDVWHVFTRSRKELSTVLVQAQRDIHPNGMIWVSWPKKSSGVASEVTEDTIRELALPTGLVDIKVCAVDQTWSALKLVVRKELRR